MSGLARSFALLLLAAIAFASVGARAADKVLEVRASDPERISLTEYFSVLEDSEAALSFEQIRTDSGTQIFVPVKQAAAGLNLGYSRSAYWLRLGLRNPDDIGHERLLVLGNGLLGSVHLYAAEPDGYRRILTGNSLPFAMRPYPNRGFVFPVVMPPRSEQVFYLRIQSAGTLYVPGTLWTPAAFYAHARDDYFSHAWYFGVATAMILFNLLLYFALRDVVYLQYVGFVTCTSLGLASHLGLGKEFLWPNALSWAPISVYVFYSLGMAAFLLFTRKMLNTRTLLAKLDRVLAALVVPFLLIPLGLAAAPYVFMRVSALLNIVGLLLILATGVLCMLKRQRSAYFFVAAFAMLCLGATSVGLGALGVLPNPALTTYALQIGSALEMLLLAFALADRYNVMRRDKDKAQRLAIAAQAEALQAQQRLVDNLQSSERQLEQRVTQRTAELQATLDDLRSAQAQLIHSEKMASLGQLVANVAHEINTPIAAVKSSGANIAEALDEALVKLPNLFEHLNRTHRELFIQLLSHIRDPRPNISSREERAARREAAGQLAQEGIAEAQAKADVLVQIGAHRALALYLPLLRHPECDLILAIAHSIGTVINGTHNINTAVERVAKIVFALKSFSRVGQGGEMQAASLREGIDTVLTIYQNQVKQGVELVLDVEDIPPLHCFPDELNQVWTNLIHNALQAMDYHGTLSVGIHRQGDDAVVSISDTGCGIAEEIRARVFDPFFTTKPKGEGSGLGLDIVRKIVAKHQGRIEFDSTLGVGTSFRVYLPYAAEAAA